MDIYLGIDFGAENIRASYLADDSNMIGVVRFNGDQEEMKNICYRNGDTLVLGSQPEDPDTRVLTRYKQLIATEREEVDGFNIDDIITRFFEKIRESAEEEVRRNHQSDSTEIRITKALVTVPVKWSRRDLVVRNRYARAIRESGLSDFMITSEPEAAAAYLIHQLHNNPRDRVTLQDGTSILVVDIGASTLDITLCFSTAPIQVIRGSCMDYAEYAGNYVDCLILSTVTGVPVDELYNNQQQYAEDLSFAKEMKELRCNRREQRNGIKFTFQDREEVIITLDHAREALAQYKNEILKNAITQELQQFVGNDGISHVDYVIFCGGMSGLAQQRLDYNGERHGFYDVLLQEMRENTEITTIDKHTIYGNDYLGGVHNMRYSISHGAAKLAREPGLITRKIHVTLGVRLEYRSLPVADETAPRNDTEYEHVNIFEAGESLGNCREERSVLNCLKKENKGVTSLHLTTGNNGSRNNNMTTFDSLLFLRDGDEYKMQDVVIEKKLPGYDDQNRQIPYDIGMWFDDNEVLHLRVFTCYDGVEWDGEKTEYQVTARLSIRDLERLRGGSTYNVPTS